MKRRTIEITVDNVSATAVLFDYEMPRTCDAIWDILPLSAPGTHGIWVGREVWLPLDGDKFLKLKQENEHPLFVLPGDLCYAYRQPHLSRGKTSGRDELAEIAIYYGRDCRLWNVRGGPIIRERMKGFRTHGYRMHFARIIKNREALEKVLDQCRSNGCKEVLVERGDPTFVY